MAVVPPAFSRSAAAAAAVGEQFLLVCSALLILLMPFRSQRLPEALVVPIPLAAQLAERRLSVHTSRPAVAEAAAPLTTVGTGLAVAVVEDRLSPQVQLEATLREAQQAQGARPERQARLLP